MPVPGFAFRGRAFFLRLPIPHIISDRFDPSMVQRGRGFASRNRGKAPISCSSTVHRIGQFSSAGGPATPRPRLAFGSRRAMSFMRSARYDKAENTARMRCWRASIASRSPGAWPRARSPLPPFLPEFARFRPIARRASPSKRSRPPRRKISTGSSSAPSPKPRPPITSAPSRARPRVASRAYEPT